jgi:hypothetical protein
MNAGEEPPFPVATIWREDLVAWPTEIGDAVEDEIGKEDLVKIKETVRKERGIDLPNMEKNPLFIGYVMAQAWESGKKSATLQRLCKQILQFAADAQRDKAPALVSSASGGNTK